MCCQLKSEPFAWTVSLSKPIVKTEKIIKGTVWRQSRPFQGRVARKCPEVLNPVPLQLPHLLWFPCHSTSRVLLSSCLPYFELSISTPMTKLQASFNLDFSLYHLLARHFSSPALIKEKFCLSLLIILSASIIYMDVIH